MAEVAIVSRCWILLGKLARVAQRATLGWWKVASPTNPHRAAPVGVRPMSIEYSLRPTPAPAVAVVQSRPTSPHQEELVSPAAERGRHGVFLGATSMTRTPCRGMFHVERADGRGSKPRPRLDSARAHDLLRDHSALRVEGGRRRHPRVKSGRTLARRAAYRVDHKLEGTGSSRCRGRIQADELHRRTRVGRRRREGVTGFPTRNHHDSDPSRGTFHVEHADGLKPQS